MLRAGSGADFVAVTLLPDGEEGRPELRKKTKLFEVTFLNFS
jgi:hypothetical protein